MRFLNLTSLGPKHRGPAMDVIATTWRVAAQRPEVVVAPLSGGHAALAPSRLLVTVLTGRPSVRGAGLIGWLERRQTRRSRLVFAPDRETAVAFALRWRLDLARIRIAPSNPIATQDIERELATLQRGRRSWHST